MCCMLLAIMPMTAYAGHDVTVDPDEFYMQCFNCNKFSHFYIRGYEIGPLKGDYEGQVGHIPKNWCVNCRTYDIDAWFGKPHTSDGKPGEYVLCTVCRKPYYVPESTSISRGQSMYGDSNVGIAVTALVTGLALGCMGTAACQKIKKRKGSV